MRAIELINGRAPYIRKVQRLRLEGRGKRWTSFWFSGENGPQDINLRVLGQDVRHRSLVHQVWFCLWILLWSNVGSIHLALRDSIQDIAILRQLIQPLFVDDNTSVAGMVAPEVVKPYGHRLAAYTELAGELPVKICMGRRIGRTE